MVLLVVLLGLYAIGTVGYYKLARRIAVENVPALDQFPVAAKVVLGLASVVWPVFLFFNLVSEAVR